MADITPPPFETSRRRPKWPLVAFLVSLGVLAMAVGALAFTLTNHSSGATALPPPIEAGTTTADPTTTTAPTTTEAPVTTTTAPTTTMRSQPSFSQQEALVRNLYGSLPGGTEQAYAMFGDRYAAKTGKANFLQFWSTIQSVSVQSVSPSGPSTVIARIRYVTQSGRVDTENRSFSAVINGGRLLLDDSVRLGPA